ncbi:MAG TPA: hypothetical protein VFT55_00280, partial [Planctomycetota bacterium]|nr:hypothetical protein [Planctomycetota bacterium]
MTTTERPVVLTDMQSFSRWSLVGFACSASAIGTGVMAAVGTGLGAAPLYVGLGMAPVLIAAGAVGLWRLGRRWMRGLTAPQLLLHLQNERPSRGYRIVMPFGLAMLALGICLSLAYPARPSGLAQACVHRLARRRRHLGAVRRHRRPGFDRHYG